jgi:tRNA (guanine37-N1)-methyltransferase
MTMRFDILTIFPNFFSGPLDHGILSRAIVTGTVQVATHDLRDFTHDRHRTVDDRPFGGGEGMILKPQPIFDCIESLGAPSSPRDTKDCHPSNTKDCHSERSEESPHFARSAIHYAIAESDIASEQNTNQVDESATKSNKSIAGIAPKSTRDLTRQSVILLSAQGKPFTQSTARRLATLDRVVLICGRYEGVDERVADLLADQELSIGDYVLSGGELAAAVIIDATVRLLPGVLGHEDSSRYESFGVSDIQPGDPADGKTPDGVPRSTHGSGGILDYPQYTRPADFQGTSIPDVLAAGDHASIRRWRRQAALAKTLRNRPDLLARASLTEEDQKYLATLRASLP